MHAETSAITAPSFEDIFNEHIDLIRGRARAGHAGHRVDPDAVESDVITEMWKQFDRGVIITGAVVGKLVAQALVEDRDDDGTGLSSRAAHRVYAAQRDVWEATGSWEPSVAEVRAAADARHAGVSTSTVARAQARDLRIDAFESPDTLGELSYMDAEADHDRAFVYDVEEVHGQIRRLVEGDTRGIDLDAPELLLELTQARWNPTGPSHETIAVLAARHFRRQYSVAEIAALLQLTPRQVEARVQKLRDQVRAFHAPRLTAGDVAA